VRYESQGSEGNSAEKQSDLRELQARSGDPMNRTIVVLSHNRPIQDRTRACIAALTHAGAAFISHYGTADVALARCYALSAACSAVRSLNDTLRAHLSEEAYKASSRETILMVDDDMEFTLEQAQALVTHSRVTGVPASAVYATTMATIAATRIDATDRWLTGLGLLAIPAGVLIALELVSAEFTIRDQSFRQFTWSKSSRGAWFSEDYTLCQRLGGVHLLPIAVGHLKTIPIYPDAETIDAIRENRRIVGDADPAQLEQLTQSKAGER
jgi:hypothetical protein